MTGEAVPRAMRSVRTGYKFTRVVIYEYGRHVFRRGFLFALFSVPFMIGVMALVVLLMVQRESRTGAIGYVDQAGVLH